MALLPTVQIKPKRDKKIRNHYPWVQKEELVKIEYIEPGSIVQLLDPEGEFLAVGSYNPMSRFPFRVLSLKKEPIDQAFFERRFSEALERRASLEGTDSYRLVFAEADRLPGLIIDRYRDVLVVQVRGMGMEKLKPHWLPALIQVLTPTAIYEKSEMEGRREEGLEPFAGLLNGEMPELVQMTEDGLTYDVPVLDGLKTGFFLDQRETRRRFESRVKPGDSILDTFCYSGAFSLVAARKGAETLGIDIHEGALQAARKNAEQNGLSCQFELANAFEWLEAEPERLFDWIVLDPPAIAKAKEKKDSLKWGIWKLAYNAVNHLKPGGRLIVCNCSYQLSLPETVDIVRLALSDRNKLGILEEVTVQAPDHPYLIQFPESLYLKCVWVRVES